MGLKKGEKLYLSNPENPDNFKYAGLDLLKEIQRRKAEEEQMRKEMQERMNQPRQPRIFQSGPPQARSTNRTTTQ
jgi:hypothetical protein